METLTGCALEIQAKQWPTQIDQAEALKVVR